MLISAFGDQTFLLGRKHTTAWFMCMGTTSEFALICKLGEFAETSGEFLHTDLQKVQLAESWRICNKPTIIQRNKLHVPGGVFPSS